MYEIVYYVNNKYVVCYLIRENHLKGLNNKIRTCSGKPDHRYNPKIANSGISNKK